MFLTQLTVVGLSRTAELPVLAYTPGVLTQIRTPVSAELASTLEHIREPAILLSRDYRVLAMNDAYRAHYGADGVVTGESRCFHISHGYDSPCDENGESCPLRATLDSRRVSRVFHVHQSPEGPEHVDVELRPIFDDEGDIRYFIEKIHVIEEASATVDGQFVGRSPAFMRVVELLRRAAQGDVPVLLLGESGSGKELAARALHSASNAARGPFVPVECTGLPEALFESELFGHARGAFTGADRARSGLVEAAASGTLFLDEIGDVPLSMQVKLLRLIESGTFRRVGDTELRPAQFRLVLATHRDLDAMVREGTFRQDLYYRINAFPVQLPPLRERPGDIPLLAEAMLRTIGTSKRLGLAALKALQTYGFPGNVRELKNILERAVLLADQDVIELHHLPMLVQDGAGLPPPTLPYSLFEGSHDSDIRPLRDVEADYLRWAEANFDGDRRELARQLGVSERTLYRKLESARKK